MPDPSHSIYRGIALVQPQWPARSLFFCRTSGKDGSQPHAMVSATNQANILPLQGDGVNSQLSRVLHSLQRNILRGVITAGPFFITWLVFTFILGVLANPAC